MKTITRCSADTGLAACSRRQALGLLGLGAVAGTGAVPGLALAGAPPVPVNAYFHDGLLRDTSGRLPAWRAPRGHQGAGQAARLSEEARIRAGIVF